MDAPEEIVVNAIYSEFDSLEGGVIRINLSGGSGQLWVDWYRDTTWVGSGLEISNLEEGIYYGIISDGNGCMKNTESISLYSTAIAELMLFDVSLFPNPTTDFIKVDVESEVKLKQISIFNATGQLVRRLSTPNNWKEDIYIGDLRTGIYTFQLLTEHHGQWSEKVVIIGSTE